MCCLCYCCRPSLKRYLGGPHYTNFSVALSRYHEAHTYLSPYEHLSRRHPTHAIDQPMQLTSDYSETTTHAQHAHTHNTTHVHTYTRTPRQGTAHNTIQYSYNTIQPHNHTATQLTANSKPQTANRNVCHSYVASSQRRRLCHTTMQPFNRTTNYMYSMHYDHSPGRSATDRDP